MGLVTEGTVAVGLKLGLVARNGPDAEGGQTGIDEGWLGPCGRCHVVVHYDRHCKVNFAGQLDAPSPLPVVKDSQLHRLISEQDRPTMNLDEQGACL